MCTTRCLYLTENVNTVTSGIALERFKDNIKYRAYLICLFI